MGEFWARKGAAVLLLERLGFGERVETTPLYRQAYASRFTFKKQLNLIGESHTAWMAWDIIRAIDLLYEDAAPAKQILADFEPAMTKEAYLAFQRGLFRKERHAYSEG